MRALAGHSAKQLVDAIVAEAKAFQYCSALLRDVLSELGFTRGRGEWESESWSETCVAGECEGELTQARVQCSGFRGQHCFRAAS